jgi:hypothetical protein
MPPLICSYAQLIEQKTENYVRLIEPFNTHPHHSHYIGTKKEIRNTLSLGVLSILDYMAINVNR